MTREDEILEIKRVIKEKIRPILVMDGGNIAFIDYTDENIVKVSLEGACRGCSMATITLKSLVEETLKEYIPNVAGVENIATEDSCNTNELNV